MSIKRQLVLCVATLCSAELYAGASATLTGVSDYLFTGISQTDSKPALQGSLDYSFDNGIYLGVWASNVDFPSDAGQSDPAHVEQDFYIGWVWDVNDAFSLNLGALRYEYTGAPSDGYDYTNYLVGFTFFSHTVVNLYFADNQDYYGEDTDGDGNNDRGGRHTWVELEQTIPLVENWDLVLGLDYDKNEQVDDFNGEATGDDYTHWKVGLATQFAEIDFELSYNDTNIDGSDDPDDLADARVVLSASKTFDF
jgi:uncharacterized protein (TIGR02001 family)